MAMKLSRLMGTGAAYWLNLQQAYDALIVEFKSDQELERERVVFEKIDYKYFRNNFMLPDLPRKIDEQIERIRSFLDIATLTVLKRPDMAARFRSSSENLTEANTIKANIMMQIATNEALHANAPKFNKKEFEEAVAIGNKDKMEDEMGDIFFATVNLARWYKIDAEQALLRANKKFTKRFKKMEEIKTKPFEEYTYEEFNNLWKQAKIEINKGV